ncbi:hypothetical protein QBC41DRAFT_235246 [Cercophora samala]|uniref:RING-type domain-containing protein n=1 Tax=Cercophora samala TaxID=330535 RepID=A0AA40D6P3_9PEZI|nr:hypothetical protein QBC41DRAFT_235246 [Cercophora samala]
MDSTTNNNAGEQEQSFNGFNSGIPIPRSFIKVRVTIERTIDDIKLSLYIVDGPLTGVGHTICLSDEDAGLLIQEHLVYYAIRHLGPGNRPASSTMTLYSPIVAPRLDVLHQQARPPNNDQRWGLTKETVIQAFGGWTGFYTWIRIIAFYLLGACSPNLPERQQELLSDYLDADWAAVLANRSNPDTGRTEFNIDPEDISAEAQAAVNNLEIRKIDTLNDEGEECAICLSALDLEDEAATIKQCGHKHFHKDCLTPWLAKSNSCPYCRHELYNKVPEAWIGRARFDMRVIRWRRIDNLPELEARS